MHCALQPLQTRGEVHVGRLVLDVEFSKRCKWLLHTGSTANVFYARCVHQPFTILAGHVQLAFVTTAVTLSPTPNQWNLLHEALQATEEYGQHLR